jgi:mannan endo-1,4-beta-mannosidase
MMLNVANEWGPTDSGDSAWATAYESAITTLRNAGYTCPLVIDSGSWGQDPADIIKYGAEVFDSDPQKNVIFSIHIYGLWGPDGATTNGQFPLDAELQQVVSAAAGKFPVILGEFGPQTTAGPSPTALTPTAIMQEADKLGLGWAAWAFDDTAPFDIAANPANPQFSLTNGKPTNGAYPNNTDLSAYGNSVILDPTYGLFTAARKASIF